jgi:hypothetical protein
VEFVGTVVAATVVVVVVVVGVVVVVVVVPFMTKPVSIAYTLSELTKMVVPSLLTAGDERTERVCAASPVANSHFFAPVTASSASDFAVGRAHIDGRAVLAECGR